jgi:ribosome-associated protein
MKDCLKKEIVIRTSRSSGPGGQHTNKVESRVELSWIPAESACLDENQKRLVLARLGPRLTEGGVLVLTGEKFRSQHRNREEVTARFLDQVLAALVPARKRVPTKPTRTGVEKRIRKKKIRGELKRLRGGRPDLDNT